MIKFNTGQIYIGSRTSKISPKQDTKYWGSPKTYKHLWEDNTLTKEKIILHICDTVEEKIELEPKLIKEAWKKYGDLCLNMHATPIFHPEICRKNGKESGNKTKELKLGIHGLSKEQRVKNAKKAGKISGKIIAEKTSKEYCFKSPTGEIVFGKNLSEFCRKNNLQRENMIAVKNGRRKSHEGWTLPETKEYGKSSGGKKNAKKYKLKSPDGKTHEGENISEFCRINNLTAGNIRKVITGKRKHHKGWTKA